MERLDPQRYPGGACEADGQPCQRVELTVRTMNFGQHWRTPDVQEVDYQVTIPRRFVADWLARELPPYVEDSQACPGDDALEDALRAEGWPSAAAILDAPALAAPTLAYFAHELLLEWCGEGRRAVPYRFVANTVVSAAWQDGQAVLAGRARVVGTGAGKLAYQDI